MALRVPEFERLGRVNAQMLNLGKVENGPNAWMTADSVQFLEEVVLIDEPLEAEQRGPRKNALAAFFVNLSHGKQEEPSGCEEIRRFDVEITDVIEVRVQHLAHRAVSQLHQCHFISVFNGERRTIR